MEAPEPRIDVDALPRVPIEHDGVYVAAIEWLAHQYWGDRPVESFTGYDVERLVCEEASRATDDQLRDFIETHIDGCRPATIEQLRACRDTMSRLELDGLQSYPTRIPIRLVDEAYGDVFESDGSWQAWYERHPGSMGLFHLGPVGLDGSGRQALVYGSFTQGGLSGSGWILLLDFTESGWTVSDSEMLWVS